MSPRRGALATVLAALALVLGLAAAGIEAAGVGPGGKEAVERFRQYLQIETAQPSPDYGGATAFLEAQGKDIGLRVRVHEFTPGKPVVLLSWGGADPALGSVLLNSHTDVVPADAARWAHPPFAARVDEQGRVFARGAQDMKCVGMQYLEAIRRLKAAGFAPRRSVHVSFVPDEEIGGGNGAAKFVASDMFRDLRVAAALDEGLASPGPDYRVFYAERTAWWLTIAAHGSPAHGSRLFDGTAAHNLRVSLNKIDDFRSAQFAKVKSGEAFEGEVVSVNNVFLKAGTATPTGFVMNLQPTEAEAGFDMRLPPTADIARLEKLIVEEWAPTSRNMTFKFLQKGDGKNKYGKLAVEVTEDSNPWWVRLKASVAKAGGKLSRPEIFMASTDARFVRYEGIPALGFSPMANTPVLLHDHNEFLHVKEYLKGIEVYEEVIKSFTGPESVLESEKTQENVIHSEL